MCSLDKPTCKYSFQVYIPPVPKWYRIKARCERKSPLLFLFSQHSPVMFIFLSRYKLEVSLLSLSLSISVSPPPLSLSLSLFSLSLFSLYQLISFSSSMSFSISLPVSIPNHFPPRSVCFPLFIHPIFTFFLPPSSSLDHHLTLHCNSSNPSLFTHRRVKKLVPLGSEVVDHAVGGAI